MVKGLAVMAVLAVFVTSGTARAQGNGCASAKLKAAGANAACALKLESGESKKGLEEDETKLGACGAKMSAAFTKAETKPPCLTSGDTAAIQAKIDTFVNNLATTTATEPPTAASSCDAGKLKAAGANAACRIKLESGAAKKGVPVDPTKAGACTSKMPPAFTKAELKPPCTATGDAGTVQGKIDAFVTDVKNELNPPSCAPIVVGQPIPGTYVLNGDVGDFRCTTNSSTNRFGACTDDAQCGGTAGQHNFCLQLPWVTADGQIMPFPTAVQTVFTVAASGSFPACQHSVCIACGNANASCSGIPGCEVAGNPNGCIPRATQGCCDQPGFLVPTFFVNILGGLCSRVDQIACGIGVVNTSNPQTGDNEVTKNGDTSDPGADCCYNGHPGSECIGGTNLSDDPAAKPCTTAAGTGAGGDYAGKIVSTIGNGSPDANGIHYRLTTPELSTTWTDSQSPAGTCANGSKYDDGELLVSQLILQAQPTTAGATGSFVDMNGDGCKRAGAGFIASTNAATDGPITVGPSPGPLRPQSYDGTVGAVSAAVSEVFSGPNSPIRDIGFVAITPQKPIATHSAVACSCTPTPGCPE